MAYPKTFVTSVKQLMPKPTCSSFPPILGGDDPLPFFFTLIGPDASLMTDMLIIPITNVLTPLFLQTSSIVRRMDPINSSSVLTNTDTFE